MQAIQTNNISNATSPASKVSRWCEKFYRSNNTRTLLLWNALLLFSFGGGNAGCDSPEPASPDLNQPPSVEQLELLPASPRTTDLMWVSFQTADPDDDPVTLSYAWAVNGAAVATTETLDGSQFDKGDSIEVTVTPNDGEDDGSPMTSATATVLNTAPEIGSVTLSPANPTESDTLWVSLGLFLDDDGDTIALGYAWAVNGTVVATTQTLDGSQFDKGDTIQVTLTPHDGEVAGAPADSPVVTVENSLPEVGQVTLSNLSPTVLDTVTVVIDSAYDLDGDLISYQYEWQVNGTAVATTEELTADFFSRWDTIQVLITPDDGTDLGIPVFSDVATAINAPPTITALAFSSPNPTVGADLGYTITVDDPEGDVVDQSVEWLINGVLASSGSILERALFRKGDAIALTVTPSDQDDLGSPMSISTTVVNAPPEIEDIVFSPDVLYTDDRLIAWVTPHDADDDEVTLHYAWTVDGVAIAHDDLNLSGNLFFDKDDLVELVVELDDGETSVFSSTYSFIVEDHPPFPAAVAIVPEQPVEGVDDLTCTIMVDSVDLDLDPISYTIRWEVDGVDYTGPLNTTSITGDTLPADQFVHGQEWVCFATPNDGSQDGKESTSYRAESLTAPNLLVILIDDVGVDRIGLYGQNPYPAPTPNIDALADQGLLFNRAYSHPTCSPTRAAMLTGRNIRRYGLGTPLGDEPYELPLEEIALPELLSEAGYTSSAIGKWHLSMETLPNFLSHPNLQGFDHYSGTPHNLSASDPDTGSFFEWEHIVDGVSLGLEYDYLTTYETDDAIGEVQSLPEPWFVWLAYHAIHVPLEPPPAGLHGYTDVEADSPPWERGDAMLEALDSEIGRVLAAMSPAVRERTTIVLAGDNGTANGGAQNIPPPIRDVPGWGERSKGTVYERGVHVPLIVAGPSVRQPGAEVNALVHLMDLYPTAAELAAIDPTTVPDAKPIDGSSWLPFLEDASAAGGRTTLLTGSQGPPGAGPYTKLKYLVRNERYKLTEDNGNEKFFDLERDVDRSSNNLLKDTLTTTEQAAYDELRAELDDAMLTYSYEY